MKDWYEQDDPQWEPEPDPELERLAIMRLEDEWNAERNGER